MRERLSRLAVALAALLVMVAAAPFVRPEKRTPSADPRQVAALARQLTNELVEAVAEAAGNSAGATEVDEASTGKATGSRGKASMEFMVGRTTEGIEEGGLSKSENTLGRSLEPRSTDAKRTEEDKEIYQNTLKYMTDKSLSGNPGGSDTKGMSQGTDNSLLIGDMLKSTSLPITDSQIRESLQSENSLRNDNALASESSVTKENSKVQKGDNVLEKDEIPASSENVRESTVPGGYSTITMGNENSLIENNAQKNDKFLLTDKSIRDSELMEHDQAEGTGITLNSDVHQMSSESGSLEKDKAKENREGKSSLEHLESDKTIGASTFLKDKSLNNGMEGERSNKIPSLPPTDNIRNVQATENSRSSLTDDVNRDKPLKINKELRYDKMMGEKSSMNKDDLLYKDESLNVANTPLSYMSSVTDRNIINGMALTKEKVIMSDTQPTSYKDKEGSKSSIKFDKTFNNTNTGENKILRNQKNYRSKEPDNRNIETDTYMISGKTADSTLTKESKSLNDGKIASDVVLEREKGILRSKIRMIGKASDEQFPAIAKGRGYSEVLKNDDKISSDKPLGWERTTSKHKMSIYEEPGRKVNIMASSGSPSSTPSPDVITICVGRKQESTTCSKTTKCTEKTTCTTTLPTTTKCRTTTSTCPTTTSTCGTSASKLVAHVFLTASQLAKMATRGGTTPVWEGDDGDEGEAGDEDKRTAKKRVRRHKNGDGTEVGRELSLVLWRASQERRNSIEPQKKTSHITEASFEETEDTHLTLRSSSQGSDPESAKELITSSTPNAFVVPSGPVTPFSPVGTVGPIASVPLFPDATAGIDATVIAAAVTAATAPRHSHAKTPHSLKTSRWRLPSTPPVGDRKAGKSDEDDSIEGSSSDKKGSGKDSGSANIGERKHESERPWLIDADGDHIVMVPSDPPSGPSSSTTEQQPATTQWHETLLTRLQKLEEVLNKERMETLKEDAERDEKEEEEKKRKGYFGENTTKFVPNKAEKEAIKDEHKSKICLSVTPFPELKMKTTSSNVNSNSKLKCTCHSKKTKEFGDLVKVNFTPRDPKQSAAINPTQENPQCKRSNTTKIPYDSRVILGQFKSQNNSTFVQRTILETAVGPGPDGQLIANTAIIMRHTFIQNPQSSNTTNNISKCDPKSKPMLTAKGRMAEMLPVSSENDPSSVKESEGSIDLGGPGLLRGRPQVNNAGASGIQQPKLPPSKGDASDDEDDVIRRRPVGVASRSKSRISDSVVKLNDREETDSNTIDLKVPGSPRKSYPEMKVDGNSGTLRVFQKIREKQKEDVASDEDASTPDKVLFGVSDPGPRKIPVSGVVRSKESGSRARVQMATPETGVMYGGDAGPEVVVTNGPSSLTSHSDGTESEATEDSAESEAGGGGGGETLPATFPILLPDDGSLPGRQHGSDKTTHFQNIDPFGRQKSATSPSRTPWSVPSTSSLAPWQSSPRHHKRPHLPPTLLILPDDRLQMAEGVPHLLVKRDPRRRYDAAQETAR